MFKLALVISLKAAPRHQLITTSMSSTLKEAMYSSSFKASFDSFETVAMRLAISCIVRKGAASSSLRVIVASLY